MRTTNWIQITTPEGKKMIASPDFILKLLGLDVDLHAIKNRLRELEIKVERLESPGRQDRIFELLDQNGRRTVPWIRARVPGYRWYDLDALVDEGLVVESVSGTHKMYGLPEGVED